MKGTFCGEMVAFSFGNNRVSCRLACFSENAEIRLCRTTRPASVFTGVPSTLMGSLAYVSAAISPIITLLLSILRSFILVELLLDLISLSSLEPTGTEIFGTEGHSSARSLSVFILSSLVNCRRGYTGHGSMQPSFSKCSRFSRCSLTNLDFCLKSE